MKNPGSKYGLGLWRLCSLLKKDLWICTVTYNNLHTLYLPMIPCITFICLWSSRLILEYSKQPEYKSLVTEEVVIFLCKTYEESIIPPLLVWLIEWSLIVYMTYHTNHSSSRGHVWSSCTCISWVALSSQFYIDELDEPEPFISTLSIALCQFRTCTENQAYELAKTLGELHKLYKSSVVPALLCFYCV